MTKQKFVLYPLIIVAVILMFASQKGICAEKKIRLNMGSTSSATSLYGYSVAVANTINKYAPELSITVVETGATRDNLLKVAAKELDLAAVATLADTYCNYNGIAGFTKPNPSLRVMWGYYKGGKMYVVRADAGISSMYDLEGKKFNPGRTGSETQSTTMQVMEILGIKPKYIQGSTKDAVAAMKDRRILGYAQISIGYDKLDASMLNVKQSVPIKIIGYPEDSIKKLREKMPWLAFKKIPAGSIRELPDNPSFYTTEGVAIGFGTKELPEEMVYKIVRAIYEHPEDQQAVWPPMKVFNVQRDLIGNMAAFEHPVPLHAGVVKYLREKKYDIPSKIVPPEAR